jgi:hypothetical protein
LDLFGIQAFIYNQLGLTAYVAIEKHKVTAPLTCSFGCIVLQEYARNLRAIGIDAREIDSYRALWQCVAPKDKQENLQF